jgi:hypothetical protein
MTDLRQAAQQALEALRYGKPNKAITILREALEQPEQEPEQEPVAKLFGTLPVYDTPPAAQRKPLTDEEIGKAWSVADGEHNASASVKRRITGAIEAAHGIKERNT